MKIQLINQFGWSFGINVNCPQVRPGLVESTLRGSLSKGFNFAFTRVSEKTMENSKRLGRQARPGIELGTY